MKHYLSKIAIVALVVLSTSCASTKYLSIDVRQPAKVKFDKEIVNIGIVNNAGVVIAEDEIEDQPNLTYEDLNNFRTSDSRRIFLEALTQFMNEEQFFHEASLYPKATRTDKRFGLQLPLMKSDIQRIAKELNTEAIVSLEAFDIRLEDKKMRMDNFYFSTSSLIADLMIRVYDANGSAISPIMAVSDSLLWLGESYQPSAPFYKELALKLSEGVTKLLIPYWEKQERMVYTDATKLMKIANKHLENKEYAEAAKVWGAAFESLDNDQQKAKIASNIAYANEILGDFENALQWANIGYDLVKNRRDTEIYKYLSYYKIQLKQRVQNNPKVLEQIGIDTSPKE